MSSHTTISQYEDFLRDTGFSSNVMSFQHDHTVSAGQMFKEHIRFQCCQLLCLYYIYKGESNFMKWVEIHHIMYVVYGANCLSLDTWHSDQRSPSGSKRCSPARPYILLESYVARMHAHTHTHKKQIGQNKRSSKTHNYQSSSGWHQVTSNSLRKEQWKTRWHI